MSEPLVTATEGTGRQPFVIIVDDEDQSSFAQLVSDQGVDAVAVFPDELDLELATRATLMVLDQYLDVWPERHRLNPPLALRVPDGLSLAAVLRSHVEGTGHRSGPRAYPVAFALRTGELDKIGVGLPRAAREHLLARQYNLEWMFDKGQALAADVPSAARRVAALAQATSALPGSWDAHSNNPGMRWLGLPDSPWGGDAKWQIEQCRPPQHVVAERTGGLAWLRWFLHRILPYPTFLIDRMHLAVALGLSLEALEGVLDSESPLADRLNDVRYAGPLSDFFGDRWWRAGVAHMAEQLLTDAGMESAARKREIAAAAAEVHGAALTPIAFDDPVVGINADYTFVRGALSLSAAVRLQPDDWPPYADDAWAARDALSDEDVDPELLAMVVSEDRWRIGHKYDQVDEEDFEDFGDDGDNLEPSNEVYPVETEGRES